MYKEKNLQKFIISRLLVQNGVNILYIYIIFHHLRFIISTILRRYKMF